jgi:hypothetical protein
MNEEESKAKLRRLVPWLLGAIFLMLIACVALLLVGRQGPVGPLLVGDVIFTSVLLFCLWRILGRRS